MLATLLVAGVAGAIALDFARGYDSVVGIDFHTYLAAALVGLRDGWSHIYDQGAVLAAQREIAPHQWTQLFLSPPPVAWMAAPFAALPYRIAYYAWGALTLAALTGSLAWSTAYRGMARWLVAASALVPWWVIHSVHVGQVAPLLAASVIVAWRLLQTRRDIVAGLVLAAVLLKPNTALLVPLALVIIGRWRALATWLVATGAVAAVALISLGPQGASAYVDALTHVPAGAVTGASQLTIGAVVALPRSGAPIARAVVFAVAVAVMVRSRREPGMALAAAAAGSLLITTYLHASDLCLFLAAGWIVWHERPGAAWRALLGALWALSTPYLDGSLLAPVLDRWVLCELMVFGALAFDAWRRPSAPASPEVLTASAASRRQAPA